MKKRIRKLYLTILLICLMANIGVGCANVKMMHIIAVSEQVYGKTTRTEQKGIIKGNFADTTLEKTSSKLKNDQQKQEQQTYRKQKPVQALSDKAKQRISKKIDFILDQKNRLIDMTDSFNEQTNETKIGTKIKNEKEKQKDTSECFGNISKETLIMHTEEQPIQEEITESIEELIPVPTEVTLINTKEQTKVPEELKPTIEEPAAISEEPTLAIEEQAQIAEELTPDAKNYVQPSAIPNWALGTPEAGWNGWVVSAPESWTPDVNAGHMICYPTGDLNYGATKYFAGHNPGIMSYLSWIEVGSVITLSNDGCSRNYRIIETKYYPNKSSTGDIFFSGYNADLWELMHGEGNAGDSIVIQFCKNGATYFGFGLPE